MKNRQTLIERVAQRALKAMQQAEEMGGPEDGEYVFMQGIEREAQTRWKNSQHSHG